VGLKRLKTRTLAIAINTFFIIVFKWTPPQSPKLALCVLAAIWTFLITIVSSEASIHRSSYYGNTGDCKSLFHAICFSD
jgi:hypothetical protein